MYLKNKVELYGVLQPHSNMNCTQLARDVDTDGDADGLTGFASFLFPPRKTQPFFVQSDPYIPWALTAVTSQFSVVGVHWAIPTKQRCE